MTRDLGWGAALRATVLLSLPGALVESCTLTAPSDDELRGAAVSEGSASKDAAADGSADERFDAAVRSDVSIHDGTCKPACAATEVCAADAQGARCIAPAAPLDGQRWEMPCGEIYGTSLTNCRFWPAGSTSCPSAGYWPVDRRFRFGGQASETYDVRLRFRGVVEPKLYSGGVADGAFYIGGGPASNSANYNSYGFTVSEPLQSYYLNYSENKSDYVFPFDYEKTIAIQGQAEIWLFAFAPTCGGVLNCQDLSALPACTPYAVPGDGPAAYNGHFIQVDVVGIKRR